MGMHSNSRNKIKSILVEMFKNYSEIDFSSIKIYSNVWYLFILFNFYFMIFIWKKKSRVAQFFALVAKWKAKVKIEKECDDQ